MGKLCTGSRHVNIMASYEVKQRIRSSIIKWKLSVQNDNERDQSFRNDVFKELSSLMECIFRKHDGTFRRNHCHPIVDIWPMTERCIFKLHKGIIARLRATPVTASPYFCNFTREVPNEVFDNICEQIIKHNSFGHIVTTTAARVVVSITEKRKAAYVFKHMNDEGVRVENCRIMRREFPDKSHAEVIISAEKPMTLAYRKNSETLSISFHYGVWNSFGVPQH